MEVWLPEHWPFIYGVFDLAVTALKIILIGFAPSLVISIILWIFRAPASTKKSIGKFQNVLTGIIISILVIRTVVIYFGFGYPAQVPSEAASTWDYVSEIGQKAAAAVSDEELLQGLISWGKNTFTRVKTGMEEIARTIKVDTVVEVAEPEKVMIVQEDTVIPASIPLRFETETIEVVEGREVATTTVQVTGSLEPSSGTRVFTTVVNGKEVTYTETTQTTGNPTSQEKTVLVVTNPGVTKEITVTRIVYVTDEEVGERLVAVEPQRFFTLLLERLNYEGNFLWSQIIAGQTPDPDDQARFIADTFRLRRLEKTAQLSSTLSLEQQELLTETVALADFHVTFLAVPVSELESVVVHQPINQDDYDAQLEALWVAYYKINGIKETIQKSQLEDDEILEKFNLLVEKANGPQGLKEQAALLQRWGEQAKQIERIETIGDIIQLRININQLVGEKGE